jgi:hypothetical protein
MTPLLESHILESSSFANILHQLWGEGLGRRPPAGCPGQD